MKQKDFSRNKESVLIAPTPQGKTPSSETHKVARASSELQSKFLLKKHIFCFTFGKNKKSELSATDFIEPAKNYLPCFETRESKYRRPTWVSTAHSPPIHNIFLMCPACGCDHLYVFLLVGLECFLFVCFFKFPLSTRGKVLVIEWLPSTMRMVQWAT